MRRSHTLVCFGIMLLLAGAIGSGVVAAQTPSGGHEQHHPTAPAAPSPVAPARPEAPSPPSSAAPPVAAPAGTGTMMQGMGEMMRGMGGTPPKELYPSLFVLHAVTPEKRADVQRAAYER